MRVTSIAQCFFKSHHGILSDTGLPCTKQYPTGAERADGRSEVPRHVSRADGCHWLCGPGKAPKSSISPTNSAWPLQGSLINCFPGALLLGTNLLWSISAASLTFTQCISKAQNVFQIFLASYDNLRSEAIVKVKK